MQMFRHPNTPSDQTAPHLGCTEQLALTRRLGGNSAALKHLNEMAWLTLIALERVRREEGVDEWDEADYRTLAYNAAWEALGENQAAEALRVA